MMMEIFTAVAPVLDVLGSVQISTADLHEAEQAVGHLAADEHAEGSGGTFGEAWALITDPSHAIAEVVYNIAVDLVIVPIAVLLYKKIREPKLRAEIHKEIDDEHGVTHEDCSGGTKKNKVHAERIA